MNRVLVAISFSLLGGCVAGDEIAAARAGIVNGAPGGPDAVVGIESPLPCSAVLVAPDVALTAAHCVDLGSPTHVVLGARVATGEHLDVIHARTHPSWAPPADARDLALLLLASKRPVPVPGFGAAPRPGERITVVGFGRTAAEGPRGERRSGTMRIESVDDDAFFARPDPSVTCAGDSGGAAFDEGGALIGIVTSGDAACSEVSRFVRLDDDARAFVRGLQDDLDRREAPDGAPCLSDEVCSSGACFRGANVGVCTQRCGEAPCAPSVIPGSRGATCTASWECDSRLCATAPGDVPRCSFGCARDAVCGEGAWCVARVDGPGRICTRPEAVRDVAGMGSNVAGGGCAVVSRAPAGGRASAAVVTLMTLMTLVIRVTRASAGRAGGPGAAARLRRESSRSSTQGRSRARV